MRQPSIHKGAPLPVAAKFCVAVVTAALALAVMRTRLFAGEAIGDSAGVDSVFQLAHGP